MNRDKARPLSPLVNACPESRGLSGLNSVQRFQEKSRGGLGRLETTVQSPEISMISVVSTVSRGIRENNRDGIRSLG